MNFQSLRFAAFPRSTAIMAAFLFVANLAWAQQVTIDFQGLQNHEKVRDYYAGGHGSLGTGPGPNYGVTFSPDLNSEISTTIASGQTVLFTGNPNGSAPAPITMNVAGGFSGHFNTPAATCFLTKQRRSMKDLTAPATCSRQFRFQLRPALHSTMRRAILRWSCPSPERRTR